MSVQDYLVARYGVLMTLDNLAELLKRTPAGLRIGLTTDGDVSKRFGPARVKIGRRVFFRTHQVVEALELDGSAVVGPAR